MIRTALRHSRSLQQSQPLYSPSVRRRRLSCPSFFAHTAQTLSPSSAAFLFFSFSISICSFSSAAFHRPIRFCTLMASLTSLTTLRACVHTAQPSFRAVLKSSSALDPGKCLQSSKPFHSLSANSKSVTL